MKHKNNVVCGALKGLKNKFFPEKKPIPPIPPIPPVSPDPPDPPTSTTWSKGYELNNGNYTLEKELGRGGFGITYLAKDRRGKRVVIKTLLDRDLLHRNNLLEFWGIFANEAVKLAQCSRGNPHIVRLSEGIIREGELPCIIMEYIEGETLFDLVAQQGVLAEKEALVYIGQIGSALRDIHQQGLLHRDVKPQNIMLRKDGSGAVLIDFGIATKFYPGRRTNSLMRTDSWLCSSRTI